MLSLFVFQGLHYEGALRFYYTSQQGQETAKVVRVQNTTTARDLVSLLLPKFATCIDPSLLNNPSQFSIAIVDQEGIQNIGAEMLHGQISGDGLLRGGGGGGGMVVVVVVDVSQAPLLNIL